MHGVAAGPAAAAPQSTAGGFTPAPGGFAPPNATGGPITYSPVQATRGGIVFVILGLSAVIAVLILIVVWALFLRP